MSQQLIEAALKEVDKCIHLFNQAGIPDKDIDVDVWNIYDDNIYIHIRQVFHLTTKMLLFETILMFDNISHNYGVKINDRPINRMAIRPENFTARNQTIH